MSWQPPTLHTPRLTLRALTIGDAPAMFEYTSREEVARYTLWAPHPTIATTESFIRDYGFKNYEKQQCEPFGITLRDHPECVIGTCGAWWSSEPFRVMEMGYALSNDYWNRGLMSEAVRAVIDHCFNTYPVNRIQAHFKKENGGSGRVMEKAGMKFEGLQRERVFHNDRYWDTVHYAILRSDWKA